jgi:tRNA A-37 threonylcarbamoyl transferase component Bud32
MPADTRFYIAPAIARRGFADLRSLLDLPGEIVSGHPDRHVVRVVIGTGRGRVAAYLKREHRVSIRDRIANACAGFGFVSKSVREARTLEQLRAAGLPVPRVLAYGECGGRAFLLVRAVRGCRDLREFLGTGEQPPWQRRLVARRLGRLLACVHAAGFDMPDLLSKHVLIHRRTLRPALIDWARTRRHRRVPTETRLRDLALLHASVANELATPRERLACLQAYRAAVPIRAWADAIRRFASALPRSRAVRESCQPCHRVKAQRLRWVRSDESLCVTSEFWRRCRGQIPDWLRLAADGHARPRTVARRWLGEKVLLRQTPPTSVFRWLASKLPGRRITSAAVRDAGVIFRLQRFGVRTPGLLAFGGRPDGSGFLLTRPVPDTDTLCDRLASPDGRRTRQLQSLGRLLRRLHDAGCCLGGQIEALHARPDGRGVIVADVGSLRIRTLRTDAARLRDLRRIMQALRLGPRTAEATLVLRGYSAEPSNAESRRLARTEQS